MDTLPPNAICNILRFFSDRPRDPGWRGRFGIKTLLDISRREGPLKELAKEQITALDLVSGEVESEELWDESLNKLFKDFGESCSALCLRLYLNIPSGVSSNSWLPTFSQYCYNLRKLEVWADRNLFPLNEVLGALKGRLEHLSLESTRHQESYFSSIANHCNGLKIFHLQLCPSNHSYLSRAFETIGPTLLTLSMHILKNSASADGFAVPLVVKDIGRMCPNVCELHMYGSTEDYRRDVEEVCIGYGAQLKRFSFPFCGKNEQFLHDLTSKCPNVSVDTGMTAPDATIDDFLYGVKKDPTKTMDILGPRLSTFSFRCGFTVTPEFATAASKCSNLSHLEIVECTSTLEGMLKDIFEQPKPHLENLRISLKTPVARCFQQDFSSVLKTLARNSGSLQSVALSCPYRHSTSLEVLARANRHLELVNIHLCSDGEYPGNSEEARGDALGGVIEFFAACPHVRCIFIYDDCQDDNEKIKAVEVACFKIRSRLVSVCVKGIWYLQ